MSHGHTDHTMGLPALVQRLGSRRVPLILHPDACLDRKIFFRTGEVNLPAPKPSVLQHRNVELIKEIRPSLLVDDMILVSGEIERVTDFEKGFPPNHTDRNGKWVSDPLIMDDQCVIINVRGKGLVVITGCGHAGVINSIIYSQDLTGVQKVHMVTGGFHLCGGLFEKIIPPTIAELKKISPRWVMPGHCTGWFATHQIARAMPDEFIPNCVGTTLII